MQSESSSHDKELNVFREYQQVRRVSEVPEWASILGYKEWYPKGIKIHVLLMMPQCIAAAGVSRKHSPGFSHLVALCRDNYMEASYDPRDFKKVSLAILKEFERDPLWHKRFAAAFSKASQKFSRIAQTCFNGIPKGKQQQLILYKRLIQTAIQAQRYSYITEAFTITNDAYWAKTYVDTLANTISEDEKNILLQPGKDSFLRQYERELARSGKNGLQGVLKKFYWVKGSYYHLPKLSLRDLEQEKKELGGERNDKAELARIKKKIINKTKNPKKLSNFIHLIETFIAMQDARKANVLKLNYALVSFVNSQHGDVKANELLQLTPHEFLNYLEGKSTGIGWDDVRKRAQKSVWVFGHHAYCLSTDEKDFGTIRRLFSISNTKLQGHVASTGHARGKAKIVLSEGDFYKVEKGDILVTSMTRPEFLPVMKQAAAYLTDEGGITSHAAIVAREMGKPCIIGMRNVTKILKDGDLIEVDAVNGIVKVLVKKLEKPK